VDQELRGDVGVDDGGAPVERLGEGPGVPVAQRGRQIPPAPARVVGLGEGEVEPPVLDPGLGEAEGLQRRRILGGEASGGQGHAGGVPAGERAEVDPLVAAGERPQLGGAEQAVRDQVFEAEQVGAEPHGAGAVVGREGPAGRAQRQHLPQRAARRLQPVEEGAGPGAEIAAGAGAGEGGGMEQDSGASHPGP